MKAYTKDLRQKGVQVVHQRGTSKSQATRLFGVSLSSVKRYTRLADRGESLAPKKGGWKTPKAEETTKRLLEEDLRTRPAATVSERGHFLEGFAGKSLSESTLRSLLKRMGFSERKILGALERDEWQRAAWKVTVAQSLDASSLVFVDEMGTNISLSPVYGWSRRGERVYCSVPRNCAKNTTLLSSMSVEGMGSSLAVEGATNSEVFETYVERVLQRIAMTLSRIETTDTPLALATSSPGSEARAGSRLPLSLRERYEIVPLKRCRSSLTKL